MVLRALYDPLGQSVGRFLGNVVREAFLGGRVNLIGKGFAQKLAKLFTARGGSRRGML
jgi:hypothetical protein